MTKWLGRLGAALIATIVLTFTIWLGTALVVWLDSVVPAPVMAAVAVVIFVVAVGGDVIYDELRNRPRPDNFNYEEARRAALARGDDEL